MAAHHSNHRSTLAFFPEVTAAISTTDWAADGTAIDHLAVEINSKEALVVDPTLEGRIQSVGKRRRIRGIRNNDATVRVKLHGTGATTAEDSQVAETYLSQILEWCMGGVHRSYTRDVVSSANAYTLTVGVGLTTGFLPGCLIAVEDTTSPTAQNTGKLHFARVASVNAGTDTIVLTEALPFTPAANDRIHGTITLYIDETVLEDAIRNGTVNTWSWYHKRVGASGGTDEIWQLEGCVATPSFANFARGQLPEVSLAIMAANFKHSGTDSLTNVSFSTVEGKPQLSMGKDVRCSIASTAATTRVGQDINAFAIEPGFSRVRVETATEEVERFEAMSTYSMAPGECKITATIVPYSDDWYAAIAAETSFRIMFYQPGPGGSTAAGAGKSWAICMPKAQVSATPSRADVNEIHGAQVEFAAMEPDDTSGGSNEELEKSLFLIGLA